MPVYVDRLYEYPKTKKWMYGKACHLMADSLKELQRFARKLGLQRRWLQKSNKGCPHYDLTEGMRFQAIKHGAIDISDRLDVLLGLIDKWRKAQ